MTDPDQLRANGPQQFAIDGYPVDNGVFVYKSDYLALLAKVETMRAALEDIANAKPEKVADGFVQGPLALWQWAQRTARAALSAVEGE